MKIENIPSESLAWNMNDAFMFQLDKVLTDAHKFRQENNVFAWYSALRGVYGMIHFKIKQPGHEKEEAELDKLFSQAQEFMATGNQRNSLQIAIYTLDAIDILLRDLIHIYRIVELEKEGFIRGEAIKQKFKNQ